MKKFSNGSVNAALIVLALGAGLLLSLKPWRTYREQQSDTRRATSQMNVSERSRADLLIQEARAKSSIGKEEMARNLGYVRSGERPTDEQ